MFLLSPQQAPIPNFPEILIDSREQKPYSFAVPSMVVALKVGDYSLSGMKEVFSIERKELGDLIGCVTFDRERFLREIDRAATLKIFWLLIEADIATIERGEYRSKASPESILGSLLAWEARYSNLRVIFAGTRDSGQRMATRILRRMFLESVQVKK